MLSYGMAKVFPGQFGAPTLDRLLEPYGQSSPMGLLWTFMGDSRPYAFFTGVVECLGGLLLFSQRTTTLGALVVAAAMGNVAMLNFSYDVPVKLYSSHLFALAVLLLLPDIPRLRRVFLTNESTRPAQLRKPFTSVWRNRAALVVKGIVIVASLWQTAGPFISGMRQPARARSARFGSLTSNGLPSTGSCAPRRRWTDSSGAASSSTRGAISPFRRWMMR